MTRMPPSLRVSVDNSHLHRWTWSEHTRTGAWVYGIKTAREHVGCFKSIRTLHPLILFLVRAAKSWAQEALGGSRQNSSSRQVLRQSAGWPARRGDDTSHKRHSLIWLSSALVVEARNNLNIYLVAVIWCTHAIVTSWLQVYVAETEPAKEYSQWAVATCQKQRQERHRWAARVHFGWMMEALMSVLGPKQLLMQDNSVQKQNRKAKEVCSLEIWHAEPQRCIALAAWRGLQTA